MSLLPSTGNVIPVHRVKKISKSYKNRKQRLAMKALQEQSK